MKKKTDGKKQKEKLPAILVIVFLFAAWQIAAMAVNIPHILPAPSDILVRLWELRESLFLHHLPATLVTVLSGWALSILIGILLAAAMHLSRIAEAMLYPVMIITQTIPVMCISPLFVLWLGYTLEARLIAVVLSTFFAIALNTFEGLQRTDPRKIEWMQTCGAGRKDIFFHLELPSAFPAFLTALKMTLPWAVIDAAVAEWLGATEGLGYFSKRMISKMDGAAVFAPIVILSAVALAGMALLKAADRKWAGYRNEV